MWALLGYSEDSDVLTKQQHCSKYRLFLIASSLSCKILLASVCPRGTDGLLHGGVFVGGLGSIRSQKALVFNLSCSQSTPLPRMYRCICQTYIRYAIGYRGSVTPRMINYATDILGLLIYTRPRVQR